MFPPPQRWKEIVRPDREREYLGFTSRFVLRSVLRAPAFIRHALRLMKEADSAPGIVGRSLGFNLSTLEFYTLSAWENADNLRTFVGSDAHDKVVKKFAGDMRADGLFVQFSVLGKDLPLDWNDAIARLNARADSGAR